MTIRTLIEYGKQHTQKPKKKCASVTKEIPSTHMKTKESVFKVVGMNVLVVKSFKVILLE